MPFRPAMQSLAEAKTPKHQNTHLFVWFVWLALFVWFLWFVLAILLFFNMLFSASRLEFKKGLRSENTSLYTQKSNVSHLKHDCVFFLHVELTNEINFGWGHGSIWLSLKIGYPELTTFHARRLDSSSRRSVLMQLTD